MYKYLAVVKKKRRTEGKAFLLKEKRSKIKNKLSSLFINPVKENIFCLEHTKIYIHKIQQSE